jgi:2,4-dienoyl-CoA reductase-like NADH-dependent reductase (Old Yellow Enzyme family)
LWEPIAIGPVTVPNRIVLSAHTTGFHGERYGRYLAERARGGAGLLVTGAVPVHPTANGGTWPGWERASIAEMRTLADAVHREGRPIVIQLGHTGVQGLASTALDKWGLLLAPSPTQSPFFGITPKVMELDDIEEVVEGFAVSAEHARAAGADGVEVHAAHGYLLCSFLSPLTNARTDQYGGSTANRARLVLDVAGAIRKRCGRDFVVGLKLNFDEFVGDAGITPPEAEQTLRIVHETRLFDYYSISGTNPHSFHYLVAPASSDLHGHMVDHAELARRAVNAETPVMVTGRIRTIAHAAEIVTRGQADLVGMIRAQIADPEVVRKAQDARLGEIRHCVGANQGCWRRITSVGEISCTVNPVTGREAEWGSAGPAVIGSARRVLVVGGGPAGMKLAETAAARGHEVTLLEQAGRLGGQIRYAGMLPHRSTWLELVDDLAASLERLGVDVRLGTAGDAAAVRRFGADVTYVATGAQWDESGASARRVETSAVPRAPGSHVVDPISAIASPESCGERVVIVDDNGDYLPLGLAEHLLSLGRAVTVVTPNQAVGTRLGEDATVDLAWVLPRILAAGVTTITSSFLERIEPDRVVLGGAWGIGTRDVAADTVVLCMKRLSDDALYRELRAEGLAVRRIGDCVAPREVDDALLEGVREGYAIA